jgi:hypothetical protein
MLKAYGFIFCASSNNLGRLAFHEHSNDPNELLTDDHKSGVVKIVSDIELACKDLDLPMTVAKVWRIANLLTRQSVTIQQIKTELKHLNETLQDELKAVMFLSIPTEAASLYMEPRPFGEQVAIAFPSASADIEEAAKCLACERYTATVFHLMRAAERMMRVLAWDRRASVQTTNGKECPIDLATWEQVIKAVKHEVDKIAGWPRTKGEIRTQALEFYNSAMEEFRAFKDAWRNHIMHGRRAYIANDAEQVMEHVKRLATTLSTRLSETERTPRVWTKAQVR